MRERTLPFSALASWVALVLLGSFVALPLRAQPARELVRRLPLRITHITWLSDQVVVGAVARFAYGASQVALVNLSTGEVTDLVEGRCPAPSPDRTRLAWIPGPAFRGDVWILDIRTQERRRLTAQASARCVRWSPDGRYLAAVTQGSMLRDEITILAADTGRLEHTVASSDEHVFDPAWYPDARRFAFVVAKMATFTITGPAGTSELTVPGAGNQVDVFDLRDRRRSLLLRVPSGSGLADLAVSPDGRHLAMTQGRDIVVFDGTSIKTIGAGHSPAWHPMGSRMIFARGYDCTGAVCAGDELYITRS